MERIQVPAVAKITELWKEYAATVNAGDMERWISLWVDDGIQLPPGAVRRVGKQKIRAEMQPLFDLFDAEMAIYPDEIQVLGDQAYTHGLYEFVMTPKEGGDSTHVQGKFLTILRRQADDSWKIAVDCFNDDAPLG